MEHQMIEDAEGATAEAADTPPTIAGIVAASGDGFDGDGSDFDLLKAALEEIQLTTTLDDPNAEFTVFAPTDAAFVSTAQAFGFEGNDEGAAFSYLIDLLELLRRGEQFDPILNKLILTHVVGEELSSSEILAAGEVETIERDLPFIGMVPSVTLEVDGTTLIDGEPDLENPTLVTTDVQASNGIVHVIDGVLFRSDTPLGQRGSDIAILEGSDDAARFGAGDDFVDAKAGDDMIRLGSGDDVAFGGGGRDILRGGSGDDTLAGGEGADRLSGGRGRDRIDGDEGADLLRGQKGDDTLLGGDGADTLIGGKGSDSLFGGLGDDVLRGGSGEDILTGGLGDDLLKGGSGDDVLEGGGGDDLLVGGDGADTFAFSVGDGVGGDDVVRDFEIGRDVVDFRIFFNGFTEDEVAAGITNFDRETVVDLGDGDTLTLRHGSGENVTVDDFLL